MEKTTIPQLVVREIIEEKDGFAQVVVSRDVFEATRGFVPKLPYERAANAKGEGIRIYTFAEGKKLYVKYSKDEETGAATSTFVTDSPTAHACLRTLEQERANEPKLEFSF